MKPLSVKLLCTIVSGERMYGGDMLIRHGAYRLKQVKQKNTVLFIEKRIMNWSELVPYLPLVIVTEWRYKAKELPEQVTVIHVPHWQHAFWAFVDYYRSQFQLPVVAITGTAGKTTTKEMVKHIVSPHKKVTATQLSANSRTALLHYLLSIDDKTEAAVFETAVGAPGDLHRAGRYFQPTIGVITNIGAHHLDHCKSVEGYIAAKGELLDVLHPNGVLIIHDQDENTKKIKLSQFTGRIVQVGTGVLCDVRASHVRYTTTGMAFTVHYQQQSYEAQVPGFGMHQVYNALMAIAVALEIKLTIPQILHQLKTYRPLNKQLQWLIGFNGAHVLDDTWSITTTSLAAALDVLHALAKEKKKVAVIGTITDVGAQGNAVHQQAGTLIYDKGVHVLLTVGEHAKIIAEQAISLGFKGEVHSFNNHIRAWELLKQMIDRDTIVLIKGDMYSQTMNELARNLRMSE